MPRRITKGMDVFAPFAFDHDDCRLVAQFLASIESCIIVWWPSSTIMAGARVNAFHHRLKGPVNELQQRILGAPAAAAAAATGLAPENGEKVVFPRDQVVDPEACAAVPLLVLHPVQVKG